MKTKLHSAALALLLFAACGESVNETDPPRPPVPPIDLSLIKSASLKPVASCEEASLAIRAMFVQEVNKKMDQLKTSCQVGYEMDAMPASAGSEEKSPDFTPTNTQEADVDEADILKTDGRNVYSLGRTTQGSVLRITRVWPFESFGLLGEIAIEGSAQGLYLAGDAAVVLSSDYEEVNDCDSYYCDGKSIVRVTVVDIQDPEKPFIVKETALEGSLISSRKIGSRIHLVINTPLQGPSLDYYIEDYSLTPECDSEGNPISPSKKYLAAVEALQAENQAEIESFDFDALVDGLSDEDCSHFYASETGAGDNALRVTTLDSADWEAPVAQAVVLGNGNSVYASSRSLYVMFQPWWWGQEDEKTILHRFDLTEAPAYGGTTAVAGHLLNSFSLGEYKGVLRVATTQGHVTRAGTREVVSQVTLLDATRTDLAVLGTIEEIARGEQIYAARFIGDRGFLVTFKKVDPLFVLDLKDPTRPAIAGELKVPGFSTYLHLLDEEHLIGLGMNADDQGSFAWFQGLKLSLFDVGDSTHPKEDESVLIGGRGSSSAALYDHHAFTLDPRRGLLALPVEVYSETRGGSTYGRFEYSGLQLYRVSADKGFDLLGTLKLENEYSNWYSNSIQRSFIVGDGDDEGIVTLTTDRLSLHRLDAGLSEIGEVEWTQNTEAPWAY